MAKQTEVELVLCIKHPDEEMDLYCKVCQTPACTICLKTDHAGHDFDTIAKLYSKIMNRRSDLIHELETQVASKGSHNRRHISDVRSRNDTDRMVRDVEQKREEIHKAVDALIDTYALSLNVHGAKLRDEVSEKENAFERDESNVLKMIETFRNTTMKGVDVIEYYEQLKSKVHALPTLNIPDCFIAKVDLARKMDRGNVQKLTIEIREGYRETHAVQQVSSFQHRSSLVHTICAVSSDEAWITYKDAKKFELFQGDGQCINKLTKDTKTHSFILHDDSILLCNGDKKNIMKFDMSGKKSAWIDLSPLRPRSIGHALNGNILITLVDELECSRKKESERKVKMLTPGGEVLHTYEYGHDGSTPMFTSPECVFQNYNSDVCVMNRYKIRENQLRGEVCVYYQDGGLRFVYKGHDNEFNPWGIACDSMCNIICINPYDKTVHLVSSEGAFVKYILTRDTYVTSWPSSIAFHKDILWIGSDRGEIHVYKYKY